MNSEKQILFIGITAFVTVFVSSLLLLMGGGKAAAIGAVIVPGMVLAYRYPRFGLLAFLLYLPFTGTISYSIAGIFKADGGAITYTSEYPLFHLAKDGFYIPALISILLSTQAFAKLRPAIKPLLIALCLFLGACLLTFLFVNFPQQFAGQGKSPVLMGIIGLKVLIGYIPLILCGYYLIRDRRDLSMLMRFLVVLVLICCGLAFIQYFLLLQGVCAGNSNLPDPAPYRATLQARCFVGGSLLYNPARDLIRLPGTFVSPWQWGWFLISSSFITYGATLSDPSRSWRIVGGVGMATVLATAVISGQRIALLLVPIIFLLLLILTEQSKRWLGIKLGIIFVLGILIATQVGIVREQIDSLISRWNYSPPPEFMAKQFQWLMDDKLKWLGHGLGRATSAARRLGQIKLIETFHVKVLYEVGILGLVTFLGLVSTVAFLTFKAYRSLQNPSLRYLGISLWVFVFFISYNPYYYPLAVDPVAVYYWFIAGVLFKLPELDREVTNAVVT